MDRRLWIPFNSTYNLSQFLMFSGLVSMIPFFPSFPNISLTFDCVNFDPNATWRLIKATICLPSLFFRISLSWRFAAKAWESCTPCMLKSKIQWGMPSLLRLVEEVFYVYKLMVFMSLILSLDQKYGLKIIKLGHMQYWFYLRSWK